MPDYLLHGLRVRTELTLPCLHDQATGEPELRVERVDRPLAVPSGAPSFDDGFKQVWRGPGPDWFVRYAARGEEATVAIHLGAPRAEFLLHGTLPANLPQMVVGPLITALLQARRILALHGTALARDGRALLLMGAQGAGKSSTAGALLEQGYHLLADDLAAPRLDQEGAWLHAGALHLKLWPDTAEALHHTPGAMPLVFPEGPGVGDKRCLEPVRLPGPEAHVLGPLLFLLPRDPGLVRPVITPIGPGQAFRHLMGNLRGGLGLHGGDPGDDLLQASRLAQACPAFLLQAPDRLSALPELAGLIARGCGA